MPDTAARLARTILSRNLRVKKGESVVIESWTHCLPYTRAFVDEARRLGAQPTVLYEDEAAWWNAVAAKRTGPFSHLSSAEKAAVGHADAYLYFWGPADMRKAIELGPIGSKFIGFNEEWYAAARKGGLRGYRMSLGLASDPTAERFGLAGPAWPEWAQWALFGALAIVSVVTFRRAIYQRLRGDTPAAVQAGPAGQLLTLPAGLAPGASCQVEYRGSFWAATNDSDQPIVAGTHARIIRVHGLSLVVRPET